MHKTLPYLCLFFLLISVISGIFFLNSNPKSSSQSFLSPLPDYLTIAQNKQVTLLDLWAPFFGSAYGNEISAPKTSARAVMMYDLTNNKLLYEKNTKERLPMASLTKIMTAIVALENPKEDNAYSVTNEALVGEDSMGLKTGEVLSLEELLYGLVLNSGNDAAEVLARNFPEGRIAFIQAMNDKARALGLTDTRFSNPSGLQGDGTQYTTVSDLLVITKYALEKPLFAQVSSKAEHILTRTNTHQEYKLFNETNLLTSYPGVKGVKTGYTPEAGLCLVTFLDYKGHKIIGIILNSENRRQEMKDLLDYSLKILGIDPPKHS